MDIQLQELIDKIKKDGIEKSSADAERQRAEVQAEARRILDSARAEAEAIVAKGKADAERFEKAATATLEQAARNLILSFRTEMEGLLESVVKREVSAAYGAEVLTAALPEVLKAWSSRGSDSLDVLLPADTLAKVEAFFAGKLAGTLGAGVTLKADKNSSGGFKIASKDGAAYYDFSADAVAELFSAYLNPRLAEIMKNASKGK